jgi:hypothetical protein
VKRKDILEMINQNEKYIRRLEFLWNRVPFIEIGVPDKESKIYKLVKELEEEYHNWKEQEIECQ